MGLQPFLASRSVSSGIGARDQQMRWPHQPVRRAATAAGSHAPRPALVGCSDWARR